MVVQLAVMGRVLMFMGSMFTFMGMGMAPGVAFVCMGMSMGMKVFMIVQVAVLVGMNNISMLVFVGMRMRMWV